MSVEKNLKKLLKGKKYWNVSFTLTEEDLRGLPTGFVTTAIQCILQSWITLHRYQDPPRDPRAVTCTTAFKIRGIPLAWKPILSPRASQAVRAILRLWREGKFPVIFSIRQVCSRSRVTREARGIFLGLDIYTKTSMLYNINQQVRQYKQGGKTMATFVGTPLQQAELEAAKLGATPPAEETPPPAETEKPVKAKGGRPKGSKNKPKEEAMKDMSNQASAAGGINLGVGLQPGIVNKDQVTAATGETTQAGFSGLGGLTLGDLAHSKPAPSTQQEPPSQPFPAPDPSLGEKVLKLAEGLTKLQGAIFDEFKASAEKSAEQFLDLENKIQEVFRNLNARLTAQTDIMTELLQMIKAVTQGQTPAATPPQTQPQTPPATQPPPPVPEQEDKFPPAYWDMLLTPASWPAAPVEFAKIASVLIPQLRNAAVTITESELQYSFLKRGALDPTTLKTKTLDQIQK